MGCSRWGWAVAVLALVWGCDDEPDVFPDAGPAPMGAVSGRVFDALTREPLAGATVEVGDQAVTTTAEGTFEAAVPVGAATLVRAQDDGHETSMKTVAIREGGTSFLQLLAVPKATTVQVDAAAGAEIDSQFGTRLTIEPNTLVKADGTPASGMVEVTVTPMLPQDPRQLAARPVNATMKRAGGGEALTQPYATVAVKARQAGQRIDLAAGATAKLSLPAATSSVPKRLSLLALDDTTGTWSEAGSIRKTDTSAGSVLKGEIDRLAFWGAEQPDDQKACIRGCVEDATLIPRVVVAGIDHTFRTEMTVDEDHCFTVAVRPGSLLGVRAEDASGASQAVVVTAPPETGSVDDPSTCGDVGTFAILPPGVADDDCPRGLRTCDGRCIDPENDPLHCGECGNDCSPASGNPAGSTCVGGSCACPPGRSDLCNDTCVDRQSDEGHCGTCGNDCAFDEECVSGGCEPLDCADGLVPIDGQCVDIASDPRYCGTDPASVVDCSAGLSETDPNRRCDDGSCDCAPGTTDCGGDPRCVDTETDDDYCGTCSNSCAGDETCASGTCTLLSCTDGLQGCEHMCVDTATSLEHCGTCGNGCAATETCNGTDCVCAAPRYEDCDGDGVCEDLDVDESNCGTCGNGCGVDTCLAGSCVTIGGACDGAFCDGLCVDTSSNDSHCGSCGNVCPDNATCDGGGCSCVDGFTSCGDGPPACDDLDVDPQNCGACGSACFVGQRCVQGLCAY